MNKISKDNIITVLLVVIAILVTLFYRENQIFNLQDKIDKTELVIKGVPWNDEARDYLINLGYNIPLPKPAINKEEVK